MFRLAAIFAISLALSGCSLGVPDEAYTVEEVLADISAEDSELHGKVVDVTGWLGECGGTNCAIFSTLDDAKVVGSYRELPDEEWMPASDRGLRIGGNDTFDSRAVFMQFSEVVVRGEINAAWKAPPDDSGTIFGCFDRCDDIRPHSITLIL